MSRDTLWPLLIGITLAGCPTAILHDASAPPDGGASDARTVAIEDAGSDAATLTPVALFDAARPVLPWAQLDALDDAAPDVTAPLPPSLTVDGACPAGWVREVTAGDPVTCEPWPTGAHASCGTGFAHLPGRAGCERIGAACPSDGWPAGAPTDALFVDDDAAAGGDGTRASPLASIGEAIARAPSAGPVVIAIRDGIYDEPIVLARPSTTLLGACPESTLLTRSDGGGPVVVVSAGETRLADLRIGQAMAGVLVGEGGALAMEGVEVHDVAGDGVHAEPGTITAERLRVARAGADGLEARRAGSITVSGLEIVDSGASTAFDRAAVGANLAGARVVIADAVIDGYGNDGLAARDQASITARRTVIERATRAGAHAARHSELTLSDLVVRATRSLPSGLDGEGLSITAGSSATLTRVLVEDCADAGIEVYHPGTAVTASDLLVRDIRPEVLGTEGYGIHLSYAGATFARVAIHRTSDSGIFAWGDGTRFGATDVSVAQIAANGIWLAYALTATLERASLSETRGLRILHGAEVSAEGVAIGELAAGGRGVDITGGALELTGGFIEGSTAGAISVTESRTKGRLYSGSITLTDVLVTPKSGPGALVFDGGELSATRVLVRGAEGFGVLASGPTRATLADTVVASTGRPAGVAPLPAIGAFDGAALTLRSVLVRDAWDAGLWIAGADSELDAMDVTVEETGGIGAILAPAEIRVARMRVSGAHEAGVLVRGAHLPAALTDLMVAATLDLDGQGGYGIACDRGARVSVTRGRFEDNRAVAAAAFGPGTELSLEEVLTARSGSASVGAYGGGSIELARFKLAEGGTCGLELEGAGALDAERGSATGHAIGACVPDGWAAGIGVDLARNARERDASRRAAAAPVRDTPEP